MRDQVELDSSSHGTVLDRFPGISESHHFAIGIMITHAGCSHRRGGADFEMFVAEASINRYEHEEQVSLTNLTNTNPNFRGSRRRPLVAPQSVRDRISITKWPRVVYSD